MSMVIINAQFSGSGEMFADRVIELLTEMGCMVETKLSVEGNVVIITKETDTTTAALATDLPQEIPADIPPAGEITVALATAEPETIAITPDAIAQDASIPAIEPTTQALNKAVVKSLSTTCSVPTLIDTKCAYSCLNASGITREEDLVVFTFCNTQYRYPVEKQGANVDICNDNPEYSDLSIRVILSLENCDNNYPCLLRVTEKTGEDSVTFGKDLAELVAVEMEHHK